MKLENLVPPFELCEQIPYGKFTDSALVWVSVLPEYGPQVLPRHNQGRIAAPAPALQEIMLALEEEGLYVPVCSHHPSGWQVDCGVEEIEDGYQQLVQRSKEDHDNPAAAALKLWLEINEVKS